MALVLQSVRKQFLYYDNPNSTLYLTTTLCFASIVFVFMLKRRRNKSIMNLPPSPPKLPIIGNLHQLGTLPHRSFLTLSKKHGPLMFLQLGQTPAMVVSSYDVAKEILKNHDVVFSSKPQNTACKIILYGCTDLAFAPYGEEWRQKRKICVLELLSIKRVKSFQHVREQEVEELVDRIRLKACECESGEEGGVVNLSELLIMASNNIVSRCVLGQKYDNPDGSGKSFGELGRKMMEQLAAFTVGDFFPSLAWVDVLTGQIQQFKATFTALDAFFDQVIEERRSTKRRGIGQYDKRDFVDVLLQIQEDGTHDFHPTHDNIKAILVDMFSGGSDTTSTLLEWTFAELMTHPNTMKKVQEEVRSVMKNKSKIDENDLNQMQYMKCVIKEILRLHPPAPLLIPRETISDVKVKGFDIPSKTRVFVNAWAIQRDPKIWDMAEEFIPERFESNQFDFMGQDLQYMPFGFGRRACVGISFGVTSTEYLLANLLYWFDWKLPNNGNMEDIDMSETYGLTVSKKVPLNLKPTLYSFGSKP